MPLRNQYVAQRVLARMQNRGEAMTLRRISLMAGNEPFKNPPDTSADLVVVNAGNYGLSGTPFFNIGGSSVIGRLVAGDQLVVAGPPQTTWTVLTMPDTVLTDADGIPQVDGSGAPVFGSPAVYNADTLGWLTAFPVIAVAFAHGPVLAPVTVALDTGAGTLTLSGGGFVAPGLGAGDVVAITGIVGANVALNGVSLDVAVVTDTILTVTGLPGGLVNGSLAYVTLTVVGGEEENPAYTIGQPAAFLFSADAPAFGRVMSYRQMTTMGWTEVDGLALLLAAHNLPQPPKVNDVVLLTASGNEKRSIVNTGRQFIDGVQFLYPIQVQ